MARAPERGRWEVAPGDAGRRIDAALAERLGASRAAAQRLIAEGRVRVDDAAVDKGHTLRAGETVTWERPPAEPSELVAEAIGVPIVYEDDWLLVVDKPAGMVVHPAPGHERGTLVQALLDRGIAGGHGRRPGVIHRLDRETSGLLIVARGEEPYRRLVAAMSARRISRTYLALLCGALAQDEGTIDAPIGRHLRDRRRMAVHSVRARPAVTHFTVLARDAGYTLARVRLETGRTHQIRVHFAALGHPVAGDATYGRRPVPEGLTRHFLHAAELRFAHPDDGRELRFASPLPAELAAFLEGLGLPQP
ncbi:MAG TPA: RluA family pseudouridine synthase [Thermoleophilia bacterium]|nr:RluA family pseudouridine synthase [Thermoleophilia bacterium]